MTQQPETKSVIRLISRSMLEAAEYVLQVFNDDAEFRLIAGDVGLDPNAAIPGNTLRNARDSLAAVKAHQFILNNQDTLADILDALNKIEELLSNLEALIDAVRTQDDERAVSEYVFLLLQMATAQTIRKDAPALYSAALLSLSALDAKESLPAFDLGSLFNYKLDNEKSAVNYGRLMTVLAFGLPLIWDALKVEKLKFYHGWDLSPTLPPAPPAPPAQPAPPATTLNAEMLLRRAFTLRYESTPPLNLTVLFVPRDHGGPGIVLSLGTDLQFKSVRPMKKPPNQNEPADDALELALDIKSGGGGQVFIPLKGSTEVWRDEMVAQPAIAFSARRAKPGGPPALRIGSNDKLRLDIGDVALRAYINSGAKGAAADFNNAKLSISLGDDADGFLAAMSGGKSLDVKFALGLGLESDRGFFLAGGSGPKVNLPLTTKLGGVFRIESLSLSVGPSKTEGMDIAADLAGIFSLDLGPFNAAIEEMGLTLDLGFTAPPEEPIDYPGLLLNTGLARAGMKFKPPAGIAMYLETLAVKGGGYLYFSPERNEYAGVFELQCGKAVHLKAAAILTTEFEGGRGWSLLTIISSEFTPIQLPLGFTLNGAGGILGLQHGVSAEVLQSGLRSGAMDHVLFPPDPVKNAPQLLNTLRTVFPVTARALTIGPTIMVGWGTPPTILAKIGLLLQWNNVILAGDRNPELSQLVLLGQLQVSVPPKDEIGQGKKAGIVSLLVDVLGSYDFRENELAIDGRLRNSKIAKLEVKGSLAVRAKFGENPCMLLAVGGFHPRFEELPPGLPSQDRLALVLKRGPLKATCAVYVAVTSNTFQFGARADIKVKAGPVRVEAHVGLDALLDTDTDRFEVDYDIGATVKFKGKTLAGVDVKGIVAGPGRWTVTGAGKVKVLIFKKRFSFSEAWGDAPAIAVENVAVGGLLQQALTDTGNWAATLAGDGNGLVTLRKVTTAGLLLHPWARLEIHQKVVPLGLNIDRFGKARPSDGNRFEITGVRVGGSPVAAEPVREHFARGRYVRDIGDRLKAPAFETFDAGVSVSSDDFAATAAGEDLSCDFETVYLDEPEAPQPGRTDARPDLSAVFARFGQLALADKGMQGAAPAKFKLLPLQYAVLDKNELKSSEDGQTLTYSQSKAFVSDATQHVVFKADYELAA